MRFKWRKDRVMDEFLQEEVRNGYRVSSEMKAVWKKELNLVQKLLDVCKKYNLKVFADAGTLLGAVRHKGFIPWDDDMDFAMFRSDYDVLLKVAKDEFTSPYFLQTVYNDKLYLRGHAQLRDITTTAMQPTELNEEYNRGIFIDIFVLDGVPADASDLEELKNRILYTKSLAELKKRGIRYSDQLKFDDIPNCFNENDAIQKYYSYIDDLLRKNSVDECEYVAPLNFIFETQKRKRKKSLYDEIVWSDFEYIKVPIPKYYDEYLTARYGDYHVAKHDKTTHGDMIYSLDKSADEYIASLPYKFPKFQTRDVSDYYIFAMNNESMLYINGFIIPKKYGYKNDYIIIKNFDKKIIANGLTIIAQVGDMGNNGGCTYGDVREEEGDLIIGFSTNSLDALRFNICLPII